MKSITKTKAKLVGAVQYNLHYMKPTRCKYCRQEAYWGELALRQWRAPKKSTKKWSLFTLTTDGYVKHRCYKQESTEEVEARKQDRNERRREMRELGKLREMDELDNRFKEVMEDERQ